MCSNNDKEVCHIRFFVVEKIDYDCEGRHVTDRNILGISRSLERAIEHCKYLCEDLKIYHFQSYVKLSSSYVSFIIKEVKDLD